MSWFSLNCHLYISVVNYISHMHLVWIPGSPDHPSDWLISRAPIIRVIMGQNWPSIAYIYSLESIKIGENKSARQAKSSDIGGPALECHIWS